MKLQNILDLSTFEITRFRVWNQTSQPSDKGLGSKYFNTNSGHEAYGREQIYTPIGWRTAAYMDDIEAINEKLDLIFGDEIDTDTIIDSWKEVQEFLAGIEDTTTLITLLDDKLSKSSGGTMTGRLTIQNEGTAWISFRSASTSFGSLGLNESGPRYWDGSQGFDIIHSGNVGDYALKVVGDNIPNSALNSVGHGYWSSTSGWVTNGAAITFGKEGYQAQIQAGYSENKLYFHSNKNGTFGSWKTIAFTDSDITGNAATATRLKTARTIWGQSFDGTGDVSGNLFFTRGYGIHTYDSASSTRDVVVFGTDDILKVGNGTRRGGFDTEIHGNNIFAKVGENVLAMHINSSGNVGIGTGTTTPQYKLDVAGDVGFSGLANLNGGALIPTGKNMMFGDASGNAIMEYDADANAIKVTGNFYATGTVASGGKAQEGTGTGGSATVYPFTLTYGQAAYQIANPKSNTNVIVQVYEWNATTSSWDLILTDVNVTASKITVTFGRTTTVNHMVTVV